MKLKEFLKDNSFLILFFFIFIMFMSMVLYFDANAKIDTNNIIYIDITGIILFTLYLFRDYIKKKRYYELLCLIAANDKDDIIMSLPEPPDYEKGLYHGLLLRVNEEYNRKLAAFNTSKKESEDFITHWVHEVKTPIAASRLVIENNDGKSKEEILELWERELDSIDNYIEQALYYSRTNSFSKDYFIDDFEIRNLINSTVKKFARLFISKKISIEIDNVDFLISSDKKWLSFILEQLLLNSLKYTDSFGCIRIFGEISTIEKTISIEDNGIGIKSEDIARVFDPGFTGYNGRTNHKSTGLGLYLCKCLCDKLGHSITIESEYGNFTRVSIHFLELTRYHKEVAN